MITPTAMAAAKGPPPVCSSLPVLSATAVGKLVGDDDDGAEVLLSNDPSSAPEPEPEVAVPSVGTQEWPTVKQSPSEQRWVSAQPHRCPVLGGRSGRQMPYSVESQK